MSSAEIYCATCGAVNTPNITYCFACGHDLSEVEQDDVQAPLLHQRYRVLSTVGQGGFAKVYRAEDTFENRIVAIKAIHLKALSAQEIIDATDTYNREIRFGMMLNHPALPKIYDSFTDQDTWYIVAEFIDGQTLEEYAQRLPTPGVPIHEVLTIGIKICEALLYLHSRQPSVIFRDLKPDNIMRTTTGRIYLIDFGIARQLRPGARRDTQILGSPGYAAPEQYGKTQTTERSDIYSLGATLRALLTGKNPLDAQHDDLKHLTTTMPKLATLLNQMLIHDPTQRPENVEIVKQQLERCAEIIGFSQWYTKQPVTRRPTSSPKRTAKKNPRRIWASTLLVAATLLALGGVLNAATSFFTSPQNSFSSGSTFTTAAPPARAAHQTLTLAISNGSDMRPPMLDPATIADTQTAQVAQALYAGLVQLDSSTHVQPQLASSWQESNDRLSWTFKLRPNLKFSDGSPLTAQDVAFSLDRALDPALHSPTAWSHLSYLQGADLRASGKMPTLIGYSILTPDPTTILLKTANPVAFLPSLLTCTCALVMEKSLVNKYGPRFFEYLSKDGASGPFRFVGQSSQHTLDLAPNPYYYGPKPQLTTLSFTFFADSELAYEAYITNKVASTEVPPDQLHAVRGADDFHATPQLWLTYYAMNYLVKPFDNIKIRQAFALALDKQLIADVVQKESVTATYHIIPAGQDGFNPLLSGPTGENSLHGNPASARWLLQTGLQEEGMSSSNQLPTITFSFADDSPQAEDEAAAAQAMWRSVLGITVQLQPLSRTELLKQESASVNNPHGLQLWRSSWSADYPDSQDWTTVQFGRNSPANTVNYGQNNTTASATQQQVQQMLQSADKQSNHDARIRLYQYAEQALVNDVAWLPLYQMKDYYLLNTSVYGYTINAVGLVPADDWANIYISQ